MKHHYVPVFYQKHFAASDGLLWVYDRKLKTCKQLYPLSICFQHDLYAFKTLTVVGPLRLPRHVARRIILLMNGPENPRARWIDQGTPRRALAIFSFIFLAVAVFAVWPEIKHFLWAHPWWQSTIAALPAIALATLAYLELRHSGEANRLRADANELQKRIGELEAERNMHLQQIAENTKKPITQAERNAETLRKHLRANVAVVNQDGGTWPSSPEIAEVSEDNIVTLFTPRGHTSSSAWCVYVHCDDLEITNIPQGSCPLRIKVLKRYGTDVQLGEITKWEDRLQPTAAPTFAKGGVPRYATYNKPGSPGTRSIHVYASEDGANSFLLEASTGEKIIGNNEEISKWFMILQVGYEAAGFRCNSSATSGSVYPLFIHSQ